MDKRANTHMTSPQSVSLLLSYENIADEMLREHLYMKYKSILEIRIYKGGIPQVKEYFSRETTGT